MTLYAGIAGNTANSYVTLGEAETYFTTVRIKPAWEDMTNTSKEQSLVESAREIDSYLRIKGEKYYNYLVGDPTRQAMAFPRDFEDGGSCDYNGDLYIPQEVKTAQCEQAVYINTRGAQWVKTDDGSPFAQISPVVKKILSNYIERFIDKKGAYPWIWWV